MDNKNERPALDEQTRAEKSERQGKDKNNILSTHTSRIFLILGLIIDCYGGGKRMDKIA